MQLNEEQTAAVEHPLGEPACLIAGAGSGKTRVLTERVRWLIAQGVPPRRICAITFTNKAAGELVDRLGLEDGSFDIPKVSTIHSLALSAIRRNPTGFGLQEKVTPLDDYDQHQMVKRILEREVNVKDRGISPSSWVYSFLERVGYHRNQGLGFSEEYTDEVHDHALVAHAGYHALESLDLKIWKLYEEEKKKNSVVDFDDMLHLVVRRLRVDIPYREALQRMFDHVLMDEAQDTNACHPPGTLIRKYIGYQGKRAITEDAPIESLVDGDRVIAWRRRWGKLTAKGSPIKVGKRWFDGSLVEVTCGTNSVQMTPDHRVYAMLNGDGETSYVVYLMWRAGFGFRVGQCALRYCKDTKHKSLGGAGSRFVEEKADKGWILRVCKTKSESRAWEQIISCQYGIPTTQFEESNGDQHRNLIELVFSQVTSRGEECLVSHGLMMEHSLFIRETDGTRKLPSKRYFETRAVNLIPGLMSLPSVEDCKQTRIDSISRISYSGWVYSMDVEKWHTYVANNLVVKNCQWEFITYLLSPTNKNLYVVGDMSQCQPPGTMVRILDTPMKNKKRGRGFEPATYKDVLIQSLPEVGVISWTKTEQRTYAAPRRTQVASRFYEGPMLTVSAENGASTRITPNHWLWVRFNKNTRDKYIVYLMYKDGYGYRVGISKFKKNLSQTGFGLSARLCRERGNGAWILRVCDTRAEAEMWEEITAIKYGIPEESVFNPEFACVNKTLEQVKLIFASANPRGAVTCLNDYGLFADSPLVERSDDASANQCNRKWRGYFRTIAANIVPIASLLDIPLQGVNKHTPIKEITAEYYQGLVYSLDVEKDHTYIADGLVVGNSIMGFIGSAPHLLKEFSEGWRGTVPTLYRIAKNHRSLPRIVYLANHIQSKMTECQPPGTKIALVVQERKSRGGKYGTTPAIFTIKDIAELTGDESIQPWNRQSIQTVGRGRPFKVSSQPYSGLMLHIATEAGNSTRVTPTHWLWVSYDRGAINGEYVIYLMHKEGVGFRVGKTRFRNNGNGFGLHSRLSAEGGERAWVLKVVPTNQEAEIWEEIYSVKYGIPESVFRPTTGSKSSRLQEHIDLIFSSVPSNGGYRCLQDHGLYFDYPLVLAGDYGVTRRPWEGYFKTKAANVVALAGFIKIPTAGICKSTRITAIGSEHYEGLVYSLDVDKHHTYVADGLVVGNSIPLKMQVFRGDAETKGTIELTRASLPLDIALIIAGEIHKDNQRKKGHIPYKENCILVRSARQVMDIENALVRYRIPYQVRGGKGLLQTEEIRDVLSYLRLVTNPKDFTALVRAVGVPKRGVGDVALEKIRKVAHEKHNGDLIMGASSVDKLGLFVQQLQSIQQYREFPVQALEQILLHMDYRNYINTKYKKEPDKAKSKLENIDRFKELVRALTEDQKMTTDDVVFQLTLDRAREDDKDGMVTVSTIHSAKGLEWKRVYVFGVVEGLLPHRFCQTPIEIQEEMRLFYVAVTRARDNLTLCVHAMEQNEGNTRRVAPSRFLIDLGIISE